jgi:hypothetical protein
MVKKLLLDTEYTIIDSKTIEINNQIKFKAKNLNLILITKDNKIVYNFACDDKRATIDGQVISLIDEEIADITNSLTIIMSFDEGSEIAKLNENILWNKRIEHILTHLLEEQVITNKYLKKLYNPE